MVCTRFRVLAVTTPLPLASFLAAAIFNILVLLSRLSWNSGRYASDILRILLDIALLIYAVRQRVDVGPCC